MSGSSPSMMQRVNQPHIMSIEDDDLSEQECVSMTGYGELGWGVLTAVWVGTEDRRGTARLVSAGADSVGAGTEGN